MKIDIADIDYEPYEFTPFGGGYFKVFVDADTKEVVGCGNFTFDITEDETDIYISFIEAYGRGSGKSIIDYLLHEIKKVVIKGESLEGAIGFWQKVGARFTEGIEFELTN